MPTHAHPSELEVNVEICDLLVASTYISEHAMERYRERCLLHGRRPTSAEAISALMYLDMSHASAGPSAFRSLRPWLSMDLLNENIGIHNILFNWQTLNAFIVRHDTNLDRAHGIATCFKAICKVCQEFHGLGQCKGMPSLQIDGRGGQTEGLRQRDAMRTARHA